MNEISKEKTDTIHCKIKIPDSFITIACSYDKNTRNYPDLFLQMNRYNTLYFLKIEDDLYSMKQSQYDIAKEKLKNYIVPIDQPTFSPKFVGPSEYKAEIKLIESFYEEMLAEIKNINKIRFRVENILKNLFDRKKINKKFIDTHCYSKITEIFDGRHKKSICLFPMDYPGFSTEVAGNFYIDCIIENINIFMQIHKRALENLFHITAHRNYENLFGADLSNYFYSVLENDTGNFDIKITFKNFPNLRAVIREEIGGHLYMAKNLVLARSKGTLLWNILFEKGITFEEYSKEDYEAEDKVYKFICKRL